jgi:hypothetical protein
MIQNWRDDWKIKDFPFYYVQIALYYGVDSTESAFCGSPGESPGASEHRDVVTLDMQ